jgi:hypothetical protein
MMAHDRTLLAADQPAAAAAGTGETFHADGVDVRVYDDALLLTADGDSERVSFSFISAVTTQDDVVTIEMAGREPVTLSLPGRRASGFGELVAARIAESRSWTAAFVRALLPALDAMSLRRAVALLSDGAAVPAASLDAIRPGISATLLETVTLPQRREPLAELQRRMPLAVGFRQVTSVTTGAPPWHEHPVTPDFYGHQNRGWPYKLGATMLEPAMLVFVLGSAGESVVSEVVNRLAPVTWVYRSPGPGGLMAADRALDAAGFAPQPGPQPGAGCTSLAGEIPHDGDWSGRLAALVGL